MSAPYVEFHRRKSDAWSRLVVAVLLIGGGLVLLWRPPEINLPRELSKHVPTGAVVLVGLGLLCLLWSTIVLRDNDPKLILSETGITDYRHKRGIQTIPWERIHSMDYSTTSENGMIRKASVQVYHLADDGEVETIRIRVTGLNRGPMRVIKEMKRVCVWFDTQGAGEGAEQEKPLAPIDDENVFRFHCPHCSRSLPVERESVGLRVRCPQCQSEVTVPEPPQ